MYKSVQKCSACCWTDDEGKINVKTFLENRVVHFSDSLPHQYRGSVARITWKECIMTSAYSSVGHAGK